MEFLIGALTALGAYRGLRSFFSEEKDNNNTAEYYKGNLANKIRLARAILYALPARQAIKNRGVEKWRTDLIAAADEGDVALQSSAADSRALEKALRNLEALTEDANAYIDYSIKSEVIELINSAAASGGNGNLETPMFVVSVPTDISRPSGRSEICHPLEKVPKNQNPVSLMRTPCGKKFCPSSKISKTRTSKISKKRRGLGLKHNSDNVMKALKHSINDCTETKGKCLEGELDEQSRHGEASMATLSCSPSSSFKGAE